MMAATGQNKQPPELVQEWHDYLKGWCDLMVDIWVDRLMTLGVRDTGALINSIKKRITIDVTTEIQHSFLEYGIDVAAGVGGGGSGPGHTDIGKFGFTHDNGGDLELMDPDYRIAHDLNRPRKRGPKWGGGYTSGKPRKSREWFIYKYLYSMRRLNERAAQYYGESYQGYLSQALDEIFSKNSRLRSL